MLRSKNARNSCSAFSAALLLFVPSTVSNPMGSPPSPVLITDPTARYAPQISP